MPYANNEGTDQLAHSCSLISAFIVHCLDSIMSLVSIVLISRLLLASVAEQAGLSPTRSQNPKDMFSRDEAALEWCGKGVQLSIGCLSLCLCAHQHAP